MIRVRAAQLHYAGSDRSVARTVAIAREALALAARPAPRSQSQSGNVPRLTIEVRVPRGASDAAIAQRIAAALARRL